MSNKIIVITGGAGFIGSNLIKLLLKKTKFSIISIDNYISGSKKNHVKNNRVKYIKSNTIRIDKILSKYKKRINSIFHFGEFSRIHQSFANIDLCFNSNILGTNSVINFCLENKIKLIYSATSATLGNGGNDKNLSPYSFTKNKNIELLENLRLWFNFKYEVIYFYNVYGPNQISKGNMATIIGIFEDQYKNKKKLTIVRPGTQSRRFTHINDTCEICYKAWKKNQNKHYLISNKKSYSIIQVAKMFGQKFVFLPERSGERFKSSIVDRSKNIKLEKHFGKIDLKHYIKKIINK